MKNLENLNLIELQKQEAIETQGGIFLETLGVIATIVGLYEFGYQYAKRHLDHAK